MIGFCSFLQARSLYQRNTRIAKNSVLWVFWLLTMVNSYASLNHSFTIAYAYYQYIIIKSIFYFLQDLTGEKAFAWNFPTTVSRILGDVIPQLPMLFASTYIIWCSAYWPPVDLLRSAINSWVTERSCISTSLIMSWNLTILKSSLSTGGRIVTKCFNCTFLNQVLPAYCSKCFLFSLYSTTN